MKLSDSLFFKLPSFTVCNDVIDYFVLLFPFIILCLQILILPHDEISRSIIIFCSKFYVWKGCYWCCRCVIISFSSSISVHNSSGTFSHNYWLWMISLRQCILHEKWNQHQQMFFKYVDMFIEMVVILDAQSSNYVYVWL
jgi:hypothetical protein